MQAQSTHDTTRTSLLAAAGAVVLTVGIVALALDRLALDPVAWLGGSGWTLFLIVPGLVLLALAVVVRGDATLGLTISGSIVTTVGLLLLYQDQNAHYESWAYAWTLIPGAVGLALVAHGLRAGRRELVALGGRMVAAFAALFVVGAWYFETVFRTNRAPFDLGDNWPIALIAFGGLLLIVGLARRPAVEGGPPRT
ncbi:MAG TPA: hypothetical protein VFO05_16155 [Candidatus Limnocylindrales bacterium]|nr:hypothetical protein [Candidatus Limnocylindrales bacterium]